MSIQHYHVYIHESFVYVHNFYSENGITTQVWIWDHNWDGVSYVEVKR